MVAIVHDAADQCQPVVLVVDRELPGKPEALGFPPEQSRRERVEGPDPESTGIACQELADPALHLACGLVGERHREDALRRDAVRIDQVRDARREHPGLAGSGAGDHQDRSMHVLRGFSLRGIEAAKQVDFGGHAAAAASGNRIRKVVPRDVGSSVSVP